MKEQTIYEKILEKWSNAKALEMGDVTTKDFSVDLDATEEEGIALHVSGYDQWDNFHDSKFTLAEVNSGEFDEKTLSLNATDTEGWDLKVTPLG